MARAKRTDRAESRRRHRAELAARQAELDQEGREGDEDEAATAPVEARPRRTSSGRAGSGRSSAPTPAPGARPSFVAGLRNSIRPASIRDDVRAYPGIVRSTPLLWVPVAIVVASGVLMFVPEASGNAIAVFLAQSFVVPPPLIGPFLAGILSPRASWLSGGIVGLIAAVVFALYVVSVGGTVSADQRAQAIVYGFITSPVFGAAIGAFAGFYRRFLRATSPQRPGSSRTARRTDGRSRRR